MTGSSATQFEIWKITRRLSQRMRKQSRAGSAAIEFAMIAPIFFTLLFAIIETGILYLAQTTLQAATDDAARLVRTGQVQTANMTQQQFRNQICNQVSAILACDARLQIDMRTYASFSSSGFTNPLNSNGTLNSTLNSYQPGNACDIVLLRTFYTWPVNTPLLTAFLVNMANDYHLLTGTAAWRNEPFGAGTC